MQAYQKLQSHFLKIAKWKHLQAICGWDQAAMMPSGGNTARGEAMAELALLIHQQTTAPQLEEWFGQAQEESLAAEERISLNAMQKHWQQAIVLPGDLVEAKSLAVSTCEHAWRSQRSENDWQGFKGNLEKVVSLSKEEANLRANSTGLNAYDALLELYEPGVSSAEITTLFNTLKTWLPNLIQQVEEQQKSRPWITPEGPFPTEQQKNLGLEAMKLLGFDFNHGRLDVSTHPFCGGVPTDIRITTRYDEEDFMTALLGVIHETGHARYEQNLPKQWADLPVGQARSMGVHESQSLFFEMQLARSYEFTKQLAPMAAAFLNREQDPAFSTDNIYAFNTRIKRGYIRVNADEVTYPAHIILRYEIEKALIEGSMNVDDIPDAWNEKMQTYLGLNTAGNYKDGCMQDIHWSIGAFGYFPSYTLGAMTAAQLFNAAEKAIPNLKSNIANGQLSELFEWQKNHIWSKGSTLSTQDLMESATGEALNADYFKKHLESRYL